VKLLSVLYVLPLPNIPNFCSVAHHPFTEIYRCSDVLLELSSCMDFVCGTVCQKNTTYRKLGLSVPHMKRCSGMYSRWGKSETSDHRHWTCCRFLYWIQIVDVSTSFHIGTNTVRSFRGVMLCFEYYKLDKSQERSNFKCVTVMRHLMTGIRLEKCVLRRFRRCASVIECTYTKLYSVAYYTPRLHGIAYYS
jgi:hypothetical protein